MSVRDRLRGMLAPLPPPLRKALVLAVGGTVLLIGVAMIVLPGPAFVVIPIGLAILSLEFIWAEALLKRAKTMAQKAALKTGLAKRKKSK